MNPFELNKNNTTKFLLPIMFPNTTYTELIANYFEEAYIGILDEKEYDDMILLKFNYNNFTEDLLEDVKEVLDRSDLMKTVLRGNVLCYEIPEEIVPDYEHYLNGKYSQMTEEAKANILEFWGQDEESILSLILSANAKDDTTKIQLLKNYVGGDILDGFDTTQGEVWPPPNVLIDEMMFEDY